MKRAALQAIRLYQRWISPMLGPACRYTPTCSQYAAEAIELHGARGVLMAVWRLMRCHPFVRGGFDPVPLPKPVQSSECEVQSRPYLTSHFVLGTSHFTESQSLKPKLQSPTS